MVQKDVNHQGFLRRATAMTYLLLSFIYYQKPLCMITKHISRYFPIFIPYDNRSRGRTPEKKKKKDRFFYQEVPRDYGRGTVNVLGTGSR